jgi:hypothetical protein
MGIGPIETEDVAPTATVIGRDYRPMTRHQSVCIPARLKNGSMHGAATGRRPVLPHLPIVDPLQGFIRTQYQARDVATDMLKACLPAKQGTIVAETLADHLWDPYDREHTLFPLAVCCVLLLLLSSSSSPVEAINFQAVRNPVGSNLSYL